MASKTKKKSFADKINSLVTTTPAIFHSDDESEDTRAKVVDQYDESDHSDGNFEVSEIRKRNVDPLDQIDERYKGKKVSRKEIYSDNDETGINSQSKSENEDSEEMDYMQTENNNGITDSDEEEDFDDDDDDDDNNTEDNESDDNIEVDGSSDESYNSNDGMSYDSDNIKDDDDESVEDESSGDMSNVIGEKNFQTITETNIKADIEKGNCVRSQLKIWENLLEMRIKFQKCLTVSNQMPQYDAYQHFEANPEYSKTLDETKNKLKVLINNMLQLQHLFFKQYPETKSLLINNRKRKADESVNTKIANVEDTMDEEIPSDTEDEKENGNGSSDEDVQDDNEKTFRKKLKLINYEKILNDNHNLYEGYRNTVIQKWNDKTRIASGKLNKGTSEPTLKQIEFALRDKDKLRKRSHLRRSEYKIVGKIEAEDDNEGRRIQEYDFEIYDDDDFYHQLLRDLIEYKSSDVTDPIQLSKQWIQLQNMRRKMKRKIDTRATKGRRIRYNVHNKLINFMAPITVNDTWTNCAKDELYNSLFGKIKAASADVTH